MQRTENSNLSSVPLAKVFWIVFFLSNSFFPVEFIIRIFWNELFFQLHTRREIKRWYSLDFELKNMQIIHKLNEKGGVSGSDVAGRCETEWSSSKECRKNIKRHGTHNDPRNKPRLINLINCSIYGIVRRYVVHEWHSKLTCHTNANILCAIVYCNGPVAMLLFCCARIHIVVAVSFAVLSLRFIHQFWYKYHYWPISFILCPFIPPFACAEAVCTSVLVIFVSVCAFRFLQYRSRAVVIADTR